MPANSKWYLIQGLKG